MTHNMAYQWLQQFSVYLADLWRALQSYHFHFHFQLPQQNGHHHHHHQCRHFRLHLFLQLNVDKVIRVTSTYKLTQSNVYLIL